MKINPFTKLASSKLGQKMYAKILAPKNEKFWNQTLPLWEGTVASAFYIASTAMQKKIDDKSKKAMQIQNVCSWIFSVGISGMLNRSVGKFGEGIIKHLDPSLMKDGHKVVNSIRVGLPILTTCLVTRYLVATALVPLSTVIRDKSKKLDLKI